jgi:hypothetical protein
VDRRVTQEQPGMGNLRLADDTGLISTSSAYSALSRHRNNAD